MFAFLMRLPSISPRSLHHLMSDAPVTIIDVNARQGWASARVPGARHLDPASYTEADLPADKDASVVFYCSNAMCRKAPTAARRARDMGYRNVTVMSAGISGWRNAGLPTDGGE